MMRGGTGIMDRTKIHRGTALRILELAHGAPRIGLSG